jgi:hypothetical protein
MQSAAWQRQQKELARQTEMINRLSGGGQVREPSRVSSAVSHEHNTPPPILGGVKLDGTCWGACLQAGRAEAAKKAMAKLKSEGMMVKKPFIEKKRRFEFPDMGKSGRIVARCENLVQTRPFRGLLSQSQ